MRLADGRLCLACSRLIIIIIFFFTGMAEVQVVNTDGVVTDVAAALRAVTRRKFVERTADQLAPGAVVLVVFNGATRFDHALEMIGPTIEAARHAVAAEQGRVVLVSVKPAAVRVGMAGPARHVTDMAVVHLLSAPTMTGIANFESPENKLDLARLVEELGEDAGSWCSLS